MSHLVIPESWIWSNWFPLAPWQELLVPVDPQQHCPVCAEVFAGVWVYPKVRGGDTLVSWKLDPAFRDPGPYVFQLQVGRTGSSDPEAWTNVGAPVIEGSAAVDDQSRRWGRRPWTHYRVVLRTVAGLYASVAVPALGNLDPFWERMYSQMVELERLRFRHHAGRQGILLKRKTSGELCSCVDPQTHEPRDPRCQLCYATGWKGGFWAPVDCVWMELTGWGSAAQQDIQMAGTVDPAYDQIQGRMLAVPLADVYDVWVDRQTDLRYYVRQIRYAAAVHSVPLVAQVLLSLLPMDHVIYDYPVYELLAAASAA